MEAGGGVGLVGREKTNAEVAEDAKVRGGKAKSNAMFAMFSQCARRGLRVELRWGHDDCDGHREDGDEFH